MPTDLLIIGYVLVALAFAIYLRVEHFTGENILGILLIASIWIIILPLAVAALVVEAAARMIKGKEE
jgi:hypothetical protein